MASPKHPAQQKTPCISDPYNVKEMFADELTGVQQRGGLCHLAFSMVRPIHKEDGVPADHERVITARVVMPTQTAESIGNILSQLKKTAEQHHDLVQLTTEDKPN